MNIAKNLTALVGHTPLVELGGYSALCGLPRPLVAKVESFNPSGSVKARTALALIDDAEQRGSNGAASSVPVRPSSSLPAGTPAWALRWWPPSAAII